MIWYFTYGSNLNHDRFRERVGEWSNHRRAVLDDYELRFSGEVESEGGGGAIVQPAPGKQVVGGVYAITHDQIAMMDEFELNSPMNATGVGIREAVRLRSDDQWIRAQIYLVPAPKIYRAPSATYLGLITSGLRDFGYDDDAIAAVEAVAAAEPQD